MRVFLGLLALIVSTIIGVCLSKKYTIRKNFYIDYKEFNLKMKNEISFSKNTLVSIIKNTDKEKIFYKNLQNYFIEKNEIELDSKVFTDDDKEKFYNYLKNLGTSDRKTQLDYINSIDEIILKDLIDAQEQEKKYKKLYIKISFLIGLIILIIAL